MERDSSAASRNTAARFYDLDNDYDITTPRNAKTSIIGLTVSDRLLCVGERKAGKGRDIVMTLCHIHKYDDGFWLAPNLDLPTKVNDDNISSPVLLSQGSVICIGDRRMKYILLSHKSNQQGKNIANHIRHGFESPPPKPRRRAQGDVIVPSNGIDQELLSQANSPFEVAEIAASVMNQQILLYTDTVLSSPDIDNVFKSFKEVTTWDPDCLNRFISNYKEYTERNKTSGSTNKDLNPCRFHPPVIMLLIDVLQVTMEPVDYNILWLKLLGVFAHFSTNLPALVNHRAAAVVLGCMAGHIQVGAIQQHGCDILSQMALYKPAPLEKGPVRESGVELIVRALRTHPNDLLVLRPGCRAVANLTTSYATLMSQLLGSVEKETDDTLEEPLAKVISVLDYIGDTAYPVLRDILIGHGADTIVHSECRRVMVFFTEDYGTLASSRHSQKKTQTVEHGPPDQALCSSEEYTRNFPEKQRLTPQDINSESSDGSDSESSFSDYSSASDDCLSRDEGSKLNTADDEIVQMEHTGNGPSGASAVKVGDADDRLNKSDNVNTEKDTQDSDIEKCAEKGHFIDKIEEAVGSSDKYTYSVESVQFLPSTDGLGSLGRRRVSLARKAGVKGSAKRFRQRNVRFQDNSDDESTKKVEEIQSNVENMKIVTNVEDEGSEDLDPERCELSRSMEAMISAPNTTSKAKGSYIKARISQYIQKLKESTRPKWNKKSKAIDIMTDSKLQDNNEHNKTHCTVVENQNNASSSDNAAKTVSSGPSQSICTFDDNLSQDFENQALSVGDSMEIATWAITSGEHGVDADLEQELRRNKTTWKRVMEELRNASQKDAITEHYETHAPISFIGNSHYCHEAKSYADQENLANVENQSQFTCNDYCGNTDHVTNSNFTSDKDNETATSCQESDNGSSTSEDSDVHIINSGEVDLSKYSRITSLEPIEEEEENSSLHFVIGVNQTTIVGDSKEDTTNACPVEFRQMDSDTLGEMDNENESKVQGKDASVVDVLNEHRYQPDINIHLLRSDHSFLISKLKLRSNILQNLKFLFDEEGEHEVTLHQMEFLLKYGETMSGADPEENNDLLLLHYDPALGLEIVSFLMSRHLSTECVFKVLQQVVEFLEMLHHPCLISYCSQLLLDIIEGPMYASIEGGLGFFTLRRLHKLTHSLLRSEEFREWEGAQQDSVSALYSKLDQLITWK